MRQIAVIGMGQFGRELAMRLTEMACQVLAIDQSDAEIERVKEKVDRAVILDARDFNALRSVITKDFDEAVVSLGESMEASVLCALHLKKLGVRSVRAKALNEDHAVILRSLGVDEVIYPERETARRLAAHMVNPNLLEFIPLDPEYQVAEVVAPGEFVGQSLIGLDLRKRFNVFVIAVKTAGGAFVFLPPPDFAISSGDILVAIGKKVDIEALAKR
jgi:trk system potassium uptake protein TrkA